MVRLTSENNLGVISLMKRAETFSSDSLFAMPRSVDKETPWTFKHVETECFAPVAEFSVLRDLLLEFSVLRDLLLDDWEEAIVQSGIKFELK